MTSRRRKDQSLADRLHELGTAGADQVVPTSAVDTVRSSETVMVLAALRNLAYRANGPNSAVAWGFIGESGVRHATNLLHWAARWVLSIERRLDRLESRP